MKLVKYFHNLFLLIFFFFVKLSQDIFRFKNKVGITGAGQPPYVCPWTSAFMVKSQKQCSAEWAQTPLFYLQLPFLDPELGKSRVSCCPKLASSSGCGPWRNGRTGFWLL